MPAYLTVRPVTAAEAETLARLTRSRTAPARAVERAQIIISRDPGICGLVRRAPTDPPLRQISQSTTPRATFWQHTRHLGSSDALVGSAEIPHLRSE